MRRQLGRHLRSFGDDAVAASGGKRGKGGGGAGGDVSGTDALRRALVRGYFANAARHEGNGHYTSILRGAPLRLHPHCTLYRAPPAWLLFHETVYGKHELILSATKVISSDLPLSSHGLP